LFNGKNSKHKNMTPQKIKNIFVEGAVSAAFIAESIAKHQPKTKYRRAQYFPGPGKGR
jgi:hypothetical protein